MTMTIERAADSGNPTATATLSLDQLLAEWSRLENAKGRTDEQVEADTDRQDAVVRLIAATEATTLRDVSRKLETFAIDLYGRKGDTPLLLASAIADLDAIVSLADPAARLTPAQLKLTSDLETVQAKLATFASAAASLGDAAPASQGGGCALFYAAHHLLNSLHRDVTDLVALAYGKETTEGAA